MKLNTIIIDDELIAREGLMDYCKRVPFINLIAICENVDEATSYLFKSKIELIFLDIQMPGITGIEFAKSLSPPKPMIIFTTAYREYGAESFDLDVIDYVVKPISFERFYKACNKAAKFAQENLADKVLSSQNFFFIKDRSRYVKVFFDDVIYIEGMLNYISFNTTQKKYVAYLSFSSIEQNFPDGMFVRIHKSYMVAVSKITSIGNAEVQLGSVSLPLSRNYKAKLISRIDALLHKR